MKAEAKRDILVAAWEEDAVSDVLRMLKAEYGETHAYWLGAIRQEAMLDNLEIYRYSADGNGFDPVDASTFSPDGTYLSRTDSTLSVIASLPPPRPGDSRWIIGLWG